MTRVRRALLFMPGDSLRKIEKGAALGVDSIVMDLEDGVALSQKEQARQTIVQALRSVSFGRSERVVRLNTGIIGCDDLRATLPARPDAFMLPKVESAATLQEISAQITAFEAEQGWLSGAIRLLALIETARGVVNLREIAASDSRLDALLFGAEDFAGSIGAIRSRDGAEVFYARSAVITHAAAFDLAAIDQIFTNLDDLVGLRAEAEIALHMGYTGKMAIHPRQVEPITAVFTPSEAHITTARQLIAAYEAHQASGTGVFAYEGKMVDAPMLRAAENILARGRAAGMLV